MIVTLFVKFAPLRIYTPYTETVADRSHRSHRVYRWYVWREPTAYTQASSDTPPLTYTPLRYHLSVPSSAHTLTLSFTCLQFNLHRVELRRS